MGIRCLLLAFLVLATLPASAVFLTRADADRILANFSHLESAHDAARRALDDRTADELRGALGDLRSRLVAIYPTYTRLRQTIQQGLDRLYQHNQAYLHQTEWPEDQIDALSGLEHESAIITEAEDTARFMQKAVDVALEHLRRARKEGVDPLDQQYDLYAGYFSDVSDQFSRYKQEMAAINRLGSK
jgi:hypothetical protein